MSVPRPSQAIRNPANADGVLLDHSVNFTFDIITARSIHGTATTAVATVFEVFLHFAFCLTNITFFLTALSSCFLTNLTLFLATTRDGFQLIDAEFSVGHGVV